MFDRLKYELSIPNPEFTKRRRLRLGTDSVPETLEYMIEHRDGTVEVPRGTVNQLVLQAKLAKRALSFDDDRRQFEAEPKSARGALRPYQAHALDRMTSAVQGYAVLPCGAGKTFLGAHLIGSLGQPTLVLVHTSDLLDQWVETIDELLSMKSGTITKGKIDIKRITVATLQTLARMPVERLQEVSRHFGCVLLDEAHHAPAAMFQSVISAMPAKYRYGLTATPEREDGLTPLMKYTFGRELFSIGYRELVDGGYLIAPSVQTLESGFRFAYRGASDMPDCMKALIGDRHRNQLITYTAAQLAQKGHTVLVLSGRVAHCNAIADALNDNGIIAKAVTGKSKHRKATLRDFREGRLRVVVACNLADEGLDVPRLDRVILAYPGKAKGRLTQRLGRLMRLHPDKQDAVLYDIADLGVRPLQRQYEQRQHLYQTLLGELCR